MAYRLEHHPEPAVVSMDDLAGVAFAVEQEAIRRFLLLAEEMSSRGQDETAAMFQRLARETQRQVDNLKEWAIQAGEPVPAGAESGQRLPPEIAASWEDIRTSSLLTPYRALAVAVANEERAFAFFSYVAAQADDPLVGKEAERLARRKLEHAALLRTWRRLAYRGDSAAAAARGPAVRDAPGLAALVQKSEAAIAACHKELSARLEAAGDRESAALLSAMGPQLGWTDPTIACADPECRSEEPAALLTAAQKPLERFSEALESVFADRADEELTRLAQERLESVVARIARIAFRREVLVRRDRQQATEPAETK